MLSGPPESPAAPTASKRQVSAVPPDVSLQSLPLPAAAGPLDAELLEAVAGGSDVAFEELRGRYRRPVERVCRMLLRGRDAEDCAQEAFVRIWLKANLFDRERGSAAAWILTVTRNVAYNLSAKRIPEPQAEPGAEVVYDPERLDALWVRAALADLPERERQVIELGYFDDLSQTQIAQTLKVPLGTVKSWMRRGLNRMADALEEDAR